MRTTDQEDFLLEHLTTSQSDKLDEIRDSFRSAICADLRTTLNSIDDCDHFYACFAISKANDLLNKVY